MGRIYTSGFEETNAAANLTTMGWNTVNGSPTISTTNPHSGTYCLLSPSTATTGAVSKLFAANVTSGTYYFRVYFRTSTATPAANTTIFANRSDSAANCLSVNLLTTGQLRLTNNANAGTTFDTTATVTADTWYRVEVRHFIHASAGDMEMRLYLGNATTAIETVSTTGVDTLITNIREQYYGKFIATSGVQIAVDDIACNFASGTFQNSWCGPGNIALLIGDSDDATPKDWTPNTGTDRYALVDDAPGAPDDDTTYVSASTAALEQWFTLSTMPPTVPTNTPLILADTMARMKGNAVTPQVALIFWDATTTFTGPTWTLTTAYAVSNTAQHLVSDLTGKIKADSGSFIHGLKLIDALEARCTALWTNIEYLEAAGGTNTSIEVPTTVYTGP